MIRFLARKDKFRMLRVVLMAMVFLTASMTVLSFNPKPAYAICCSDCCTCITETFSTDFTAWIQTALEINIYIWIQLFLHQLIWFDITYWEQHMLPTFMHMGNQLAAVGTFQVMIIGKFIDAKVQLETQRLLQEMNARASKDYHPSVGMCEFGTRMVSLAASERKGEANALILSRRSTDRFLGNVDTGARGGTKDDTVVRLGDFRRQYCDVSDNGGGLNDICSENAPPLTAVRKARLNKDVDYQRAIENPWTIGFDLTGGGTPSDNDEEVVAMANNLYGYDSFIRSDFENLKNIPRAKITDSQQAYLNMRSVVAKTKVAENSFNALMAMKGEGTAGSRDFISSYLEELGMPSADIDAFLGTNPSYNAQMEILTKKAYQSPLFYTNLYDKPANVERKGVAMQAIGLIQKFDLLKSYLRTEASLSVLLEVSVEQMQREVEDNIQAFDTEGITLKE
tara:strand:+ start:1919 stop:3277 length:1359 start_codon:yes stop_codon:yes gene_type:complete